MRVGLKSDHVKFGNAVTGGYTSGTGFTISWQHGPLGRGPDRQAPNGAFVEDVIAAAMERLEAYQSTDFACEENAYAITLLRSALRALEDRTRTREHRGVEGTHKV